MSQTMTRVPLYEATLRSTEPLWELRGVVRALLTQGIEREDLERELTDLMLELRAAGREQEEDVVYEVLQYLVGFCSPFMKL
jgi:hypothetical protein